MTARCVQAYYALCDVWSTHYNYSYIRGVIYKGCIMKLLTNKIKIIITAVATVLLLAVGLYGGIQIGKNSSSASFMNIPITVDTTRACTSC